MLRTAKAIFRNNLYREVFLQVDRDGTAITGDCVDSSSTDSDDNPSTTGMQDEHHDACEAPMAVALNIQQHYVAVQQTPALDADGFQTIQKPSRRRAGHA